MHFEESWNAYCEALEPLQVKNVILSKDGEIIARHSFDDDCYRNGYSTSKTFTATLVAIAEAEGLLSLDEYVVDCFPESLPEVIPDNLRKMQVKHLISMTLGHDSANLMGAQRPHMKEKDWVRYCLSLPVPYEPGTKFVYTNAGPYLAGMLVAKRTGKKLVDYLNEKLYIPMGWHYPSWEVDPYGNALGSSGLMVTAEMLHSLGLLYLNRGMLGSERLFPEEWVDRASVPFLNDADPENDYYGYGYSFWMGPNGSFRADGSYGQYSLIIPEKKIVLATTSDCMRPRTILNLFWKMLYDRL